MHRRYFIKTVFTVAAGTIVNTLCSKLSVAALSTKRSVNNGFPANVEQLFGSRTITESDDIHLNLPETAEDGAVVPITISSELEGITRIYIWVEKNPTPLAAEFELDQSVIPFITARIKMAESCNVTVVAQQDGQLLRRQQWVNVMQGGCGTG